MKSLSTLFRRFLLFFTWPAALVFTSCGDDDLASPDQGRVLITHAAASANVKMKALVDNNEIGQLDYGKSSFYLNVNAGTPTFKISVASNGNEVASQAVTIASNQYYSVFAYAPTSQTVGLVSFPDDLTAPASGKAKIRIVHLGQGAPTSVKLSTTVPAVADIPSTETQFGNASPFVEILPGSYNLAVTSGSSSATVTNVGDGTGSGSVGNKAYEAGKIYTVVVRGVNSTLLDPTLQPRAVIIQNN
ncbi:DUF4397 domain-containing protein [Hymenobacter sp. YC55]|uniref:DUF4397 domain-containing protein n=1 Tax=Hymenobacter sp. YC55 TaxID=3034019 RepID=UPI0023F6D483|nr:DUF4397 domain-containing protein [Hymenobacter sp. YC55]MDF7813078.1 DUF4397 domain-containing protein [Hymenobacter sp. YC55]